MKIYMGYDAREAEAYRVAVRSLAKFTKTEVTPMLAHTGWALSQSSALRTLGMVRSS